MAPGSLAEAVGAAPVFQVANGRPCTCPEPVFKIKS